MGGRERNAFYLGVFGAIAVFVVLLTLVGADRVVASLASARPVPVVVTFAFALCWLTAWSSMFRTILAGLGVSLTFRTAFLVYSGAVFANNVTPFGQAGGEPVAAALVSKLVGSRYETGLAGIASVDVLNVIPSLSLLLVGLGSYATTATVGDRLEATVGVTFALVSAVVLVVTILWRYRWLLVDRVPALLAPGVSRLGIDRFATGDLEGEVTDRIRRFVENLERIGTDRGRLLAAVALSLAGWLFQAVALAAAFASLGHSVPLSVLLFVIPLANVAGAAPLPGGLGGIEAAFVSLLVPTTGIEASAVTAAVLIFRGAVYWMPIVIGGTSVSLFGVRVLR
ncbi:lysylphosphatidylglycerol synthase transmembrane domain-containing protein [Halopiger goleimassiliensis]|uniref:lysylphosphatidylglycerol synthase transmembrane domain-containing protein n=1 Tax=Halopiger goleimassiliensis TaxID=1293048 RepID=UPI0006780558|nr:lysylphosphatidylglycerol synthase transmembrane domain-containing protein [Halopiger goleimassiliensis]